jgi:hypothetical protein
MMSGKIYRPDEKFSPLNNGISTHTFSCLLNPAARTPLLLAAFLILLMSVPALTSRATAQPGVPTTDPGTIAYIHNFQELHLIQPDGSQDRTIFTAPMVGSVQSAIEYTAWRPDGAEIAFVSDMAQSVSLLQSDVFAIRPDGGGLRQITDPPLNSQLGSFQTGSVAVQVTNENVIDSLFIIYVQGAQQAQSTTVPAGTSKTVTFNNVAIFPGQSQFPVAINGLTRWFGSPDTPTFQPGMTNGASIDIADSGYDNFGAVLPAWRSDSQELDYHLGDTCVGEGIPTNPAPGSQWGDQLVQYVASMCHITRGPTSGLTNQIVYWDYEGDFPNGAFMEATEGANQPTMLFDTGYGGFMYGVDWLPDGSGFLFTFDDSGSCHCSDVYSYNFASQQVNQLTHFSGEYAGNLSISPDGQQVVFEHFDVDPNPNLNPDAVPDLWLMNVNGTNPHLFLQDASDPAWGAPHTAAELPNKIFTPLLMR